MATMLLLAACFRNYSWILHEDVERDMLFESEFKNFAGAGNDSYARAAVLGIRDTYNDYGFAANKNVMEWLLGRESRTMEQYIRAELERLGYPAVG